MERKVDIQELSNFLMDYTTSMMGVGVHTARAVRSVSRIAESFGYGIDVTIFQKNITMTIKHPEDYSIRRTYVRKIPAFGWGKTPDIALASSVLYLIPGVPLINSIIDILGGHVLIGMSRAVNAAILIICIALGLSVTLLILGLDTL